MPEASWVHTSLLHPSGHPLMSFWALGFSRYQPQPAGSPGRSNQPVPPSLCQSSGLQPYLAAGARWKGRAGLSATPNHQCARGRPARPAGAATGGRPGQILTGRGRGRGDCMQPRPEIRAETPRTPLRTGSSRRMLETNRVCRRAYSSQSTSVAGQLVAETIGRLRGEAAKREV